MSAMPANWASAKIGELCRLVNGKAFKPSDWGVTGLPIVRIQNLNQSGAKFNFFDGPVEEKFLIQNGDLLFAWSGTPGTSFGAHTWNGPDAILNQHIFNVHYNDRVVDREFFRCAINQTLDEQIAKAHGGVGLAHVTKGRFEETIISLPPINEQRRIVAKIDSLSAKSKRARDQLDHIPRLVEKYKQAILATAFRGDLTADWSFQKTSEVKREWHKRPLAEICDPLRPITYGVIKLGSPIHNGVPCLRTSNVRWLRIETEGMKRISPKLSSEYGRTVLRGGEVLVNVRGTLGGVAVATSDMAGWNVSREVAVAAVDAATVEPNYVAYWIGADASQRWLNRVEKGVAYTGVNIEDLRKLPIEFPPLDEQREIVRRVETAFAWIDRLASEASGACKLIDHLDQAILAKAFRGELVPQDPSDEPASALLERIRADRATVPSNTVTHRRGLQLDPRAGTRQGP